MRPRALDLFCGAGGASMGLHRAGFDVTGVDIKPQPRYPFKFVQADAMEYPLDGYDFIWSGPPCQAYSQCTPKQYRNNHPQLIAAVRERIKKESTAPFVIENVPSAKYHLFHPIMLCGSMFGLQIRRHRFFEMRGFFCLCPGGCAHTYKPVLITGTHRRTYEPRYEYSAEECRQASGLTWMIRTGMDEAIPPAYSEFIGKQALQFLTSEASS
jgi:DNA (cytosine-5)-methyltransferase 1